MKSLLLCSAIAVGGVIVPVQDAARAQEPLYPIPTCVEVAHADIGASARRKSTRADCDPETARNHASLQARFNASNDLAATCIARTARTIAARTCAAAGLRVATGGGVANDPIPRAGTTRPDAAISIGRNSVAQLCTVLRDLPNETTSSTSPASAANGFCIFNNGRVTTVVARARATCGVGCL